MPAERSAGKAGARIDTLRLTYGEGLASGSQGDKQLHIFLEESRASPLSEYLRRHPECCWL